MDAQDYWENKYSDLSYKKKGLNKQSFNVVNTRHPFYKKKKRMFGISRWVNNRFSEFLQGGSRSRSRGGRTRGAPQRDKTLGELNTHWEKIVGKPLAKETSPLKFQHRILTIMTSSPYYSQSLSFLTLEIKKNIEKAIPSLKNQIGQLTFKVMPQYFRERELIEKEKNSKVDFKKETFYHPHSPVRKVLLKQAEEEFGSVEDEDLKKLLVQIYIKKEYKNS